MFIIEGSDELGKTTLANKIVDTCKNSGFPVFYSHMSRPNSAFNFSTDYYERMSVHAVQDRFHLGAKVWHSPDMLPTPQLRLVEGQLLIRGSVTLIVYASNEEWYRQTIYKGKPQDFSVGEILDANRKFKAMVESHSVYYDFAHDVYEYGYPGKELIDIWLGEWFSRLIARRGELRDNHT